jgi:hypothetical protein
MTEPTGADFITIADAAELLEVSERQARRYAKRLPDDDRRRPDTTTGATVAQVRRASILEAYSQATGRKIKPDTATGATSDTRPAQAGHDDGQRTRDREEILFLRGLVEQRDRDAAELRAALREALKAMPKAITAGDGVSTQAPARDVATKRDETTEPAQPIGNAPNTAQRPPETRGAALQQLRANIKTIFKL